MVNGRPMVGGEWYVNERPLVEGEWYVYGMLMVNGRLMVQNLHISYSNFNGEWYSNGEW